VASANWYSVFVHPYPSGIISSDEGATGKFRVAADNRNANEGVKFKGNYDER
jgi:hypothetical protein